MNRKEKMSKALEALKTLNHPVRLNILCNLIEREEMSAGEIFEIEKDMASQSQVSQYLKLLRDMKYVECRKEGQHVFYKISSNKIKSLIERLHELFCEDSSICN